MKYGSTAWQGRNATTARPASIGRAPRLLPELAVVFSQLSDAVFTERAVAEMLRAHQRTQDRINRLNARLRHALRVLVVLVAAGRTLRVPAARPAARPASPNAPNAVLAARLA
ncbi:hypothetical protein [Curtobacterium sp. MCSS17_005]|uniref:hypothetical protein n=1 Tax=Curtobacterium sp. MCSS17_005 TaxID=2175641 RepID=UPI000DA9E45A|nr:hypothetical protein [Curtobacterium sp. MCSS17_005]WIB33921.1 hypothetical protein DEJ20_05495 [Curtobacterium sp. MCSS17_005]